MPGRLGCLAHSVRKRQQVIVAGLESSRVLGEAEHLPTAGCGQSYRMLVAQVVGMWLGVQRERTEHGGLVGIDVGERGNCGPRTSGA